MAIFPAGESISIEEIAEAKNYFCNYIGNFLKENNIFNKNIFTITNTKKNTNTYNIFINNSIANKVKVI